MSEDASPSRELVRHARTVSLLTIVSRLGGLLRDATFAAVLGLRPDAFFVAFQIPNLFRRLFGEGALTAAFIPRYGELVDRDPEAARRFATAVVVTLSGALSLVTALAIGGIAVALSVADLTAGTREVLGLTALMLPYMPLICTVAILGAIQQVHGRFAPSAAAPILLNAVLIGAAFTLAVTADDAGPQRLTVLGIGVLVAGALQLLYVGGSALALVRPARTLAGTGPALRALAVTLLPTVLGLAVFQLNALFDTLLAYALTAHEGPGTTVTWFGREFTPPIADGGVSTLQYAQRLQQFPIAVFGLAVATAIFPLLGRLARAGERDAFAETVSRGLRLTLFVTLPAAVGLAVAGAPIVSAILERGAFDAAATSRVAGVLVPYGVSVVGYGASHLLTRAHYALDDTRTPVRIALVSVGVNVTLNLTLVWPLAERGLAWSSAVSATLTALLLARSIRGRGFTFGSEVVRSGAISSLLAVGMGAVVVGVDRSLLESWSAVPRSVLLVGVGVLAYGGGAALLRSPELASLRRRRR